MSIRDPARWQRVQELFAAALARPRAERDAFVHAACADDPELETDVARLLDADREADDFIESAIARGAACLPELGEARLAGRRIGNYRLIRELGHGGMGMVYLAERADEQFEKRVAIKLIGLGLASAEGVRRFRHERQILADLEHPAIAQLLDGGTTEDGWPYLVMEYVDGEPVDVYCARRRLGLRDRLELFRTVCAAVDHAHQSLVVHRDLKPANILVTAAGEIKLLDFGIAKLLEPKAVAAPTATLPLMTPQYASPEQVRGGRITTASDVYALGVILYQLLAGDLPYRVSRASAPTELERQVCVEDPPPPSALLRHRPPAGHPIGAGRVSGDLDSIVMKALRKERSRRYASVAQLDQDLERHLRGLPVSARQGTLGYRAGKLLRRYRVALAVLVAFVVLAVGFTLRVIQERDKAEQAVALFGDLVVLSEPAGQQRRATMAELQNLDQRLDQLVEDMRTQPRLQGVLLDAMGRLYHKLGLYDRARPLLERALTKRRGTFGDDLEVAESLVHLADLLSDTAAGDADYRQTEALQREAIALRRRLLGDDDPLVTDSLSDLAVLLAEAGADPAEVETLTREVLTRRRRALGEEHPLVAKGLNDLATVLYDRGEYVEAVTHLRQALVLYREQDSEDDPDYAMVLGNLGLILREIGQLEEAETHLRRALALDRELFGDGHDFVAQDLDNLAALLQQRGAFQEAETGYREALRIRRSVFGDDHPETITSRNNLAVLLNDRGDFEAAEELLRRVVDDLRRQRGDEHPDLAVALVNLAQTRRGREDLARAEELYREALAIHRRSAGESHPQTAQTLRLLGALLNARGARVEAETLLRRALAVQRERLGDQHREVAITLAELGRLLTESGHATQAEPLLREALAIHRSAPVAGDWRPAEATSLLGACLAGQGRSAEAEPLLREGRNRLASDPHRERVAAEAAARLEAFYRAQSGRRGAG